MNEPGLESVGRRVAAGARQMIMLRIGERLVGLASFSILARFLVPADFGLLALATSVIAVIELFGQAGIDLALIQRRSAGREEYDTAWTINVIVGAVVACVVLVAAAPLALVLNEPRLERILYFLAAAAVVGGCHNIGVVDFEKFFEFGKEFRIRITTRVLKAVATIGFALAWRDYWALVAGYLAGTVVMVALSYAMHPYRPQLSLRAIRSFTHFSGWMLARGIANGTSEHLVNLIIGRIVTVSGLAFFSAGRELAEMATTELQAPIRRAMFPGFAAVGHDPAVLRRSYLEWTAVMVLFTFPVPAGLALVAPDIVRVLMGEQWLPAVALLQILACAGILRSSASGAQQMFVAVGRPRLSALLALLRAIAVIPLVLLGALAADAAGAAWAMFATAALMFVVNLIVVTRVLQLPRSAMLRVTWRPVVATLAMAAAIVGIDVLLPDHTDFLSAAWRLVAAGIGGGLVYFGSLAALWSLAGHPAGAESRALEFLRPYRGSVGAP